MIQYISDILQSLSKREILSYFFGIASLLFAIFSYVKSNRKQNPQYLMWTARLRSSMFENSSIEIKHGDRSIPELSVSKVAIWNKGITIKREDVASKVPLQVVVPDNTEILEVQALYVNEANNIQYTLSEDHRKIKIDFDYLAKDEGVVLKFFHTCGEGSSIKVHCALKSGVKIAHARGIIMRFTRLLSNKISIRTATRFLGIMVMLLCVVEILSLFLAIDVQVPRANSLWAKCIQLVIYLFLLLYVYRAFFYRRLPKKMYKAYNDE